MSELYPATHQPSEASTAHDKPSWPSGVRLCESESPASAFAVAGGSLPGRSAEALIGIWEHRVRHAKAMCDAAQKSGDSMAATAWAFAQRTGQLCANELIAAMESANRRQPEENDKLSHDQNGGPK